MDNVAFILTCYKNLSMIKQSVERIRSYKELGKSLIYIISTSEEHFGLEDLTDYKNKIFAETWLDAPGNPYSTYKSKPNSIPYLNFRHEFLPPRILLSLQKGIEWTRDHNIEKVCHIHPDGYFKNEKMPIERFERLDQYTMIGDGCSQDVNTIDHRLFFHPENLFLNIEDLYGIHHTFDEVFLYSDKETSFRSHNYSSVESLVGNYLHYSICNRSILTIDDPIDRCYLNSILIDVVRPYHGDFGDFINLPGIQS